MKTFDEVVKWIRKNVSKDQRGGHKTVRDAAKWFVAYKEAQLMRESNTTKDYADMLLSGIRPLNPVATVKWWAEEDGDAAVTEDELRLFFGLAGNQGGDDED